ncbi:DUF6691 family protein [Ideonella livida]|uniref:DUF6691 family protein n=1 Tax=Ideonella livida TaxID=2707176 RepID=UPI001EF1A4CB|nr:DUF6691 family protein [Ideonella livida]
MLYPTPSPCFALTPARALAVFLCGGLFGYGLSLSTMIQPQVVLSFLRWQDFGLTLVMGGGVAVILLAYGLGPRLLRQPLLGGRGVGFDAHLARLDRPTVLGSALFGVGWGLCGVCPGPAIAGLGAGMTDLLWALAGMAGGALLQGWWADRRRA